MYKKTAAVLSCSLVVALFLFSSNVASAATLTVSNSCSDSDSTCHSLLSAAVKAAEQNDTIQIEPGTYTESETITIDKDNLSISGIETARTIIEGTGSGALMQVPAGVTGTNISRLTINSSPIGIQLGDSATVKNNIFVDNVVAVNVTGTATVDIINNTFWDNTTAISSTVDNAITNNIFTGNDTALSAVSPLAQFDQAKVTYNIFDNNAANGFTYDEADDTQTNIPSNNQGTDSDPRFVNPDTSPGVEAESMDLHLKEGSPAIGKGSSGVEIGAFGDSDDTIPFIISGVTVTGSSSAGSAEVTWDHNLSHVVTNSANPGGYKVYYRRSRSGSDPGEYDNEISVASTSTSAVVSGLTTTVNAPASPVLNEPAYANQTLLLSWSVSTDATTYYVHYTDLVTLVTKTTDVGNTTVYALTNLVNGRQYSVSVSAGTQPTYYFSVTAFDNTVAPDGADGEPGISHESAYSEEVSLSVGTPAVSAPSEAKIAFPEAIQAFPNLPNSGCFIATAAYGYYSAPQVQALRRFRDLYLMTNAPGRAFVQWYYRYGPVGAAYLNAHPWLKPAVRAALLPAVGAALFMVEMPLPARLGVFFFTMFVVIIVYRRNDLRKSGGVR